MSTSYDDDLKWVQSMMMVLKLGPAVMMILTFNTRMVTVLIRIPGKCSVYAIEYDTLFLL